MFNDRNFYMCAEGTNVEQTNTYDTTFSIGTKELREMCALLNTLYIVSTSYNHRQFNDSILCKNET